MTAEELPFLQVLVYDALKHPERYKWTLQGFGMLRCYPGDGETWRLNVWDRRYRVPNVSDIHDHPWDFTSIIITGLLSNSKYAESLHGTPFHHCKIITGVGGKMISKPDTVRLRIFEQARLVPGSIYTQTADEIHATDAAVGTVTLNRRVTQRPDQTANLYWTNGPWVSAHPRTPTDKEVAEITKTALENFK